MSDTASSTGSQPVEVAVCEDAASWDRFVEAHEDGSYCHLYAWREVIEGGYRRATTYLWAQRMGRVVGVLPFVRMSRRSVSMPYLDLGGPLATDEQARRALIDTALAQGAPLESRESGGESEGVAPGGRYRFLLSLPGETEELWSSIGGKVRNQVRKSEKCGLATERVTADRVEAFYEVFARNMRDLGSPVHSKGFLIRALATFGDRARLYLTRDSERRTVAGAIGVVCGSTLTVPWASALRAARASCPNHSLYWQILGDAIGDGLERFDFGRSTVDTGTFRFKKQWGATPVPLAWRLYSSEGSSVLEQTVPSTPARLAVGVWKRLPLALANRIGPRIRGRLSQ